MQNLPPQYLFAKHAYSSSQVDVPEPLLSQILAWGPANVRPEDVDPEDGFEDKPHVTVKYGFTDATPEALTALLAEEAPGSLTIGPTAIFQTEGRPDVLFCEVDSPDLHRLNKALSRLPHVDTHDGYKPHLTLAYLKEGTGAGYAGLVLPFSGQAVEFSAITFSDRDRNKQLIPLGGSVTGGRMQRETFDCCGTLVTSANDTTREGVTNGIPWIEKRARLFVAGTYTLGNGKKKTYVRADLERMSASVRTLGTEEEDWDIPVQLSHEYGAQETVGNVRSAEVVGDTELWGVLRIIGQDNVAKVKGGLWRKLSIGHLEDFSIDEVSITPFPRVRTAQLFSEAVEPVDPAEPTLSDQPDSNEEEAPVAEHANKEQTPAAQPPAPPVATAAATFDAAGLEAKLRAEFAEANRKEAEAMKAQFAAQQEQIVQMQRTLRLAAIHSRVEQFKSDAVSTPGMAEAEVAFIEALYDDAKSGDDRLALYAEVKAKQPKFAGMDLEVYGKAKAPVAPGGDDEDEDMQKEAGRKLREAMSAGKGGK